MQTTKVLPSAASLLQTYLHLLRFDTLNGTALSRPVNPWRLNFRDIFVDTHFKSLSNVSHVLAAPYTRVMFVRHPFARLASAYKERIAILDRDRVESESHYDNVRKQICRKYSRFSPVPRSPLKQDPCKEFIPPFEHFIEHILSNTDTIAGVAKMDAHWQPYSVVCQVCRFKYNFIGKYETFDEDFITLVKRLNVSDWNMQKRLGASGYTKSQYQQLFSTVPDALICRLRRLYKDDFRLFNYQAEEYVHQTHLVCQE